jgi:transcriptional regulator with XRE-family HTH domain
VAKLSDDGKSGTDEFKDPSDFIKIKSHPGGRPTKYSPTWCDEVILLGERGYSRAQIAAEIGVFRDAINEYEAQYPEFSDAMKRANERSLAWWEQAGRAGMFMKGFSAAAYSLQMRNRFRGEYTDETETKHKIDDSVAGLMARIDGRRRSQD